MRKILIALALFVMLSFTHASRLFYGIFVDPNTEIASLEEVRPGFEPLIFWERASDPSICSRDEYLARIDDLNPIEALDNFETIEVGSDFRVPLECALIPPVVDALDDAGYDPKDFIDDEFDFGDTDVIIGDAGDLELVPDPVDLDQIERLEERLDQLETSFETDVQALSADLQALNADVLALDADVQGLRAENEDFFADVQRQLDNDFVAWLGDLDLLDLLLLIAVILLLALLVWWLVSRTRKTPPKRGPPPEGYVSTEKYEKRVAERDEAYRQIDRYEEDFKNLRSDYDVLQEEVDGLKETQGYPKGYVEYEVIRDPETGETVTVPIEYEERYVRIVEADGTRSNPMKLSTAHRKLRDDKDLRKRSAVKNPRSSRGTSAGGKKHRREVSARKKGHTNPSPSSA